MVMQGINLLKNRHTISEKDYKREESLFRYAIVSFAGIVVVTMALGIWQFVLSSKLGEIEDGIIQATEELAGLAEANAQQLYLKSRLKLITSYLEDRSVTRQALEQVFSYSIPGVVVTGMGFESDKVMLVQLTAENALDLGAAVDFLSNDETFFLQAVSRGVTRSKEGSYHMEVLLTIPKES